MNDFYKDFSPEEIKQSTEDLKEHRLNHPVNNGISIQEFEKKILDKAQRMRIKEQKVLDRKITAQSN